MDRGFSFSKHCDNKNVDKDCQSSWERNKTVTKSIFILDKNDDIKKVLKDTPVSEFRGVGTAYAESPGKRGIRNARELSNMFEEWTCKNMVAW